MTQPVVSRIIRTRRQESRCVACGVPVKRVVLCAACRPMWLYCPTCETVWSRIGHRLNSVVCPACRRTQAQRHRPRCPQHQRRLAQLIALYRKELPLVCIAALMQTRVNAIKNVIRRARRRREWPSGLYRHRQWYTNKRKGSGQ